MTIDLSNYQEDLLKFKISGVACGVGLETLGLALFCGLGIHAALHCFPTSPVMTTHWGSFTAGGKALPRWMLPHGTTTWQWLKASPCLMWSDCVLYVPAMIKEI